MSKEEAGCKLASIYKHKERKPKKPHYIPRPWGKPYNYKCFQCPFTCMEKSHLYNHMKYSLCKNSLSLLIESDWPYKKGHLLPPQLRLVQATENPRVGGQRDVLDTCNAVMVGTMSPKDGMDRDGPGSRPLGKGNVASSERMSEKASPFQEEGEEEDVLLRPTPEVEPEEKVMETQSEGLSMDPDENALLFQFKNKEVTACKESSPDFIITDVFSLKKHSSKGKDRASGELESKTKHCKVAKKCPNSNESFSEQWKLVANGQKRSPMEVLMPGPEENVIPCFPPPAYGEFQESQGLNLSLLGIHYPLGSNLFSCLSPLGNSRVASHSHLPFLTSATHLLHPPYAHFQPWQNSERSTFLPRFYYPLLFDHSFTTVDSKGTAAKPNAQHLPVMAAPSPLQVQTSTEPLKGGLSKVPALKAALPWLKSFCEKPLPEQSSKRPLDEEKKWLGHEKETGSSLTSRHLCRNTLPEAFSGFRGTKEDTSLLPKSIEKAELPGALCLDSSGAISSHLKRKMAWSGLDVKRATVAMPEEVTYQGSSGLQVTPRPSSKSMDHWEVKLHDNISEGQEKIRSSDVLPPRITASSHPFVQSSNEPTIIIGPEDEKVTPVLIGDLSKTLEEYQEVEKNLSHLAKEDTPGQEHLRDQLVKIRHELFHIHQTLEKATKSKEGPLDLSVKRSSKNLEKGHQDKKELKANIQDGNVQGKDPGATNRYLEVNDQERESSDGLRMNKNIDLLIKMNHSKNLRTSSLETPLGAVIKAEGFPPVLPLEFRHAMDTYYGHTTKCEADSSVLLCTDGRLNASQGLPLSATEDVPLGVRTLPPRSLTGSRPSETDKV